MEHGSTTMNLQANISKHEAKHITQDQEIEKCAFCRQSDVDAVLGLQ